MQWVGADVETAFFVLRRGPAVYPVRLLGRTLVGRAVADVHGSPSANDWYPLSMAGGILLMRSRHVLVTAQVNGIVRRIGHSCTGTHPYASSSSSSAAAAASTELASAGTGTRGRELRRRPSSASKKVDVFAVYLIFWVAHEGGGQVWYRAGEGLELLQVVA